MKRAVSVAGFLALLAILGWWAARRSPPTAFFGPPEALAKLKALEEILRSKNDNDPRLDSDFNALSADAKRVFREKYRSLPLESRNERGTIVYLLGKNLTSTEDWEFLRRVALEPPCLSLTDCSRAMPRGLADEVTLAYPSLVALKQAQRALEAGSTEARSVVAAGKRSKVPAVARLAVKLERRFGAAAEKNL